MSAPGYSSGASAYAAPVASQPIYASDAVPSYGTYPAYSTPAATPAADITPADGRMDACSKLAAVSGGPATDVVVVVGAESTDAVSSDVVNMNSSSNNKSVKQATIVQPESSDDDSSQEQEQDDEEEEGYNKDLEAVMRIKEELENKSVKRQKTLFCRLHKRSCPQLTVDALKPSKQREHKIHWFVVLLLVTIITAFVVVYQFYEPRFYYVYRTPHITVNEKTMQVELYSGDGSTALRGSLFQGRPAGRLPLDCSLTRGDVTELCLVWRDLLQLRVRQYLLDNVTCHQLHWTLLDPATTSATDCYRLEGAQLYGGGLMADRVWPLAGDSLPVRTPFTSGRLGPLLEPYWVTSRGVTLVVDDDSPLYVSLSRDVFCVTADYSSLPAVSLQNATFSYNICVGSDPRHVHTTVTQQFVDWRAAYAAWSPALLTSVVWSTWTAFSSNYTQTTLTQFGRDIDATNYSRTTMLLIDDGWQDKVGDLQFAASRFPDVGAMMHDLQQNCSMKVSVSMDWQLGTDSQAFQTGVTQRYMVPPVVEEGQGQCGQDGVPVLMRSCRDAGCRGVAGVVDVTQSAASDWFRQRLVEFIGAHHVHSLHFSEHCTPHRTPLTPLHRDLNYHTHISTVFASKLISNDSTVFVQSAYRAQHLPVVFRLTASSSSWNGTGGLSSIIPSVLALGLVGYPLVLPPAIAGAAPPDSPTKELYIRWMEVLTFLPIMHLSILPSQFDAETESIARKMVQLHSTVTVPHILSCLPDSTRHLSPIIRPLWWLDPTDPEALKTSSEFLLGDSILVAPVLVEGARHRDIYLPAGRWHDQLTFQLHDGPVWLHRYTVTLDNVAFFKLDMA